MDLDSWIQSINAETLESILVDILVTDGSTYSGYINSEAFKKSTDSILLTSRTPKAGYFVGKKIYKNEILGFSFSTAPRTNFGVHHFYLGEKGSDLHFQHLVHNESKVEVKSSVNSKIKFASDCMNYLRKLKAEFLPNEQITLEIFREISVKYNVDSSKVERKVREFLKV